MLKKSLTIYLAKMAGYGFRLIVPIFLSRILSTSDFGQYRQFFLMEITISTIFQLGVDQALYYFIPRDEENAGAYFLNSLLLNLLIFSTVFAAIRIFSESFSSALNMPLFLEFYWYLLFYVIAVMLNASVSAYLIARQFVKEAAVFQVGGQLLISLAILGFALTFRNLEAVFLGLVVAGIINLLAILIYVQLKFHGFRAKKYFFGVWTQIKYGLMLGAGGALWVLQARVHELFVSRYYGPEGFAIYSTGCTQIPIVEFYLQSVAVVSLGQFAVMEKNNDWEGIRALWNNILTSLFAIAIPGVIFLLLISEPLITTMFPPEYSGAVVIFRINTLVKLCMIWNAQLVLRAMDRNDIILWVNLVVMIITPFALYLAMGPWGTTGIIATQFGLMLLSRVGLLAIFNRFSGHYLPYFVEFREVLDFYRNSWQKIQGFITKKSRV